MFDWIYKCSNNVGEISKVQMDKFLNQPVNNECSLTVSANIRCIDVALNEYDVGTPAAEGSATPG